ncbi:hypothetical protein Q8F55_001022 [Vanrija albida]|uniref:Nudix hydrolase domain-containing protein n=1 Tax=Vanrija albida TaxID=181172 RepID=A0ABR3QFE8_9TREE
MLSIRDVDLFVRREPADGWLPVQEEDEQHEPSARPPCRDFSLVFVIRDETERTVLLGKKKRGLGKGMFNGFGGKREPGETMQECAIRELQEECGLRVAREHMQPRGTLTIVRPAAEESGATIVANIHLFTARQWQGAPVETEEMTPAWFNIEGMPYDEMA